MNPDFVLHQTEVIPVIYDKIKKVKSMIYR